MAECETDGGVCMGFTYRLPPFLHVFGVVCDVLFCSPYFWKDKGIGNAGSHERRSEKHMELVSA